jgi:hypothetical protein
MWRGNWSTGSDLGEGRFMRTDPHELKEAWLNRALIRARIEREHWRPGRGVADNRRTIEAVYGYYGRLFLQHPHLKWAGMASTIGPAFYAGFRDLGLLPDAARKIVAAVCGPASPALAKRVLSDLGFYETTFLTMQKKIFEDQATMHEAYVSAGISEIEKLRDAGIIDAATLEAWQQIDAGHHTGDSAAVDRGNRTLLFREQYDIIDRFYIQMLQHRPPEGVGFTYLLTLVGAPSIPGAESYPERFPLTLVGHFLRAAVSLRTPLTDGNIAVFSNRWKLIEADTLPKFLTFVRDRAAEARELVATPVERRAERYRLLARAGNLAAAAITGWRVKFEISAARDERPGSCSTKLTTSAETRATAIDLTRAPSREATGLAEGVDSRIWMNADWEPLDVTVALPGGRTYCARAEMAVILSAVPGGNPDRLIVRLPSAGVDDTERLLKAYAAEWGFPTDAVAGWRVGCEHRAGSDRQYSTQTFTPPDVGFVRLEFQASHHVRERDFVVAALFSWHIDPP